MINEITPKKRTVAKNVALQLRNAGISNNRYEMYYVNNFLPLKNGFYLAFCCIKQNWIVAEFMFKGKKWKVLNGVNKITHWTYLPNSIF